MIPKMFVFIGIVFVAIIFSVYAMRGGKAMDKKVLFVLMPEGYQDLEFNTPYKMLADKGCTIDVAGLRAGEAKGSLGGSFTPNKVLNQMSEADLAGYDILIIPGGPGSVEFLWKDVTLSNVIKYFYNNKKIVASICYATVAVAKTGVLKGKKATGFPSTELKDIFNEEGVEFVDNGYFIDKSDKMITAQSPKFAQDFGREIIKMLED